MKMKMIHPIQVLKEVIRKHESALKHSMVAFDKRQITAEMNRMHRRNNIRIINRFKKAIKILEEHGKERFI